MRALPERRPAVARLGCRRAASCMSSHLRGSRRERQQMGERGVMRRVHLAASRQAIVSGRQRAPQALQRQGNNVCQCNGWGHCKVAECMWVQSARGAGACVGRICPAEDAQAQQVIKCRASLWVDPFFTAPMARGAAAPSTVQQTAFTCMAGRAGGRSGGGGGGAHLCDQPPGTCWSNGSLLRLLCANPGLRGRLWSKGQFQADTACKFKPCAVCVTLQTMRTADRTGPAAKIASLPHETKARSSRQH